MWLFVAGLGELPACTVFCHGQDDTVLTGRNFDVPDTCKLAMQFVPAVGKTHGRVRCGRASDPCADGMNDQGLFVAVADVPTPWKVVSHKLPADLNTFIDGVLANCASVEEAYAWCKRQPTPRLGGWIKGWSVGNRRHPLLARYTFVTLQHVLVADHTGSSMVCEWVDGHFRTVRKTGRYQLMTNFLLSAPEWACRRFTAGTEILAAAEKPSIPTCIAVLKATAQDITKYSLACDLVAREIRVYVRRDFDHPRIVNLADELLKGRHEIELGE